MKKAVVAFVLVWAGLWPLAHRFLVARFDTDPWKLSGWAMYTTPSPPVLVAAFARSGEGTALLDESKLPVQVREAMDRFRLERHALGRLRPPDDVAHALLQARPDLDSVLVVVQRKRLDAETAKMVSSTDRYAYRPDEKSRSNPPARVPIVGKIGKTRAGLQSVL